MLRNFETLYPDNFFIEDKCLYEIRTTSKGSCEKKLCNFLPWIVREIIVDDGAETKTHITLGGEHEDGHTLPECEISAEDLASFHWLHNHWGIDCILETGNTVKDSLRYAIQSTAHQAERTTVYTVTGWREIHGQWHYLMPGDSEQTVQLSGKMQHYGMERHCEEKDISAVLSLLDSKMTPAEILYPMLAFTFLSPLNHFLKLAGHEPKFILFLVGRTGSRKSTLAALFLSFFGRFTGAELPLSFRDTANSILHHAFALKDVLTCIDDFHPAGRTEEARLTTTAQSIMRAYGDRTGRGRLRPDASPQESRPPQGNAVITGEFPPDIGESGTARYFSLELHEGDVNLEVLTTFQRLAADGVLQRCMFGFVEWVRETWLSDLKNFTAVLKKNFEHRRDLFQKKHPTCHGRILEAAAWLEIGMQMLLSFLCDTSQLDRSASNLHEKAFHDLLLKMIERQTVSILEDKPTHKFLQNLYALIQSGQVCLLSKDVTHNDIPENCIGYEDDSMYYLFNETTYKTVRKFCKEQGVSFTTSPKALLKQLAEEGFLDGGSKQHTKTLRFNHKNKRVVCLFKDKIEQLISIPQEKESDSLSA